MPGRFYLPDNFYILDIQQSSMRIHYSFLIVLISLCIHFTSCVPQQKVATTKTNLSAQDSLLQIYRAQLVALERERKRKQDLNQLDDTANQRIAQFISKTQFEIDRLHGENTILIGTVEVKKSDWDHLRKNLTTCLNLTKRVSGKINFLSDLINRNLVLKLDQDIIFEPGKFTVNPTFIQTIERVFEPVALAIDSFTQKYPGFPLSLAITAKGYADASEISETSTLYKDLVKELQFTGQKVTRESLNKYLSNLRARSVIELFQRFSARHANRGNIIFVYKGKGEEFPDPSVMDYRTNDPRRRVVLLRSSIILECVPRLLITISN
jgi:hypothetical protein